MKKINCNTDLRLEKSPNNTIRDVVIPVIFSVILTATLFITSCGIGNESKDITQMQDFIRDNKYIIHACGEIADENGILYTYTNSKEALENSLNRGNKVIEIDFHKTSDDVLVCGHAWGDLYMEGKQMEKGVAPSYEDFLKCKVQDKFTPLSFKDVISYMQKDSDFVVVTDIKDENVQTCKMIAQTYPELRDRFIIQIYHADEYDAVKKAGFKYIIFTLYETDESERTADALKKIANKSLIGFTVYSEWADDKDFYDIIKSLNKPVYVHTVNDQDEINRYFDMGIQGIYTDNV